MKRYAKQRNSINRFSLNIPQHRCKRQCATASKKGFILLVDIKAHERAICPEKAESKQVECLERQTI